MHIRHSNMHVPNTWRFDASLTSVIKCLVAFSNSSFSYTNKGSGPNVSNILIIWIHLTILWIRKSILKSSWEKSWPMRDDVTHVTPSLIGRDWERDQVSDAVIKTFLDIYTCMLWIRHWTRKQIWIYIHWIYCDCDNELFYISTFRPEQNGRHSAAVIFKCTLQ